jgi:hypothetical protein
MECPNCGKSYKPKYKSKEEAKKNNDIVGVEQYKTGICSRKCYLQYVGSYIDSISELKEEVEQKGKIYLTIEDDKSLDTIVDAMEISRENLDFGNYNEKELDNLIRENIAFIEL